MKLINWKKYRGFKRIGKSVISKEDRKSHLMKASWLTAMVESGGKFGCVINFDGTAATFGLHQAILVYPRELKNPDQNLLNDQGPGWKLLNLVRPIVRYADLWDRIREVDWHIGRDNKVRYRSCGEPVSGLAIRKEIMGTQEGIVPNRGPVRRRCKEWIEMFAEVFDDEFTFNTQEEFGMEHFAKRADRVKFRFCRQAEWKSMTMNDVFYRGTSVEMAMFEDEPELDLALCMYWSHSVNAPGQALKLLCRALPSYDSAKLPDTWPRRLIKILGTSSYGRWDDDIKNGRYQRTRKYAMTSGFWPERFFKGSKAIMPKDL